MTDGPWIDFDGDGEGEEYETVELEDGSSAYVHYDEETGEVDSVAVDHDNDGLVDEMVVDSDGDGTLDSAYQDVDGDGWMDEETTFDESDLNLEPEVEETGGGGATFDGFIGEPLNGDGEQDFGLGGDDPAALR